MSRSALAFTTMISLLLPLSAPAASNATYTLEQILHFPFSSELAAAQNADVIAWVREVDGVRNIWLARGPDFKAVQITQYGEDDGQELTQLTFSPDGSRLVYVRGGDHDSNWPAEGNLAPDPAFSPEQPTVTLWSASLTGGAPVRIAEGDTPAISATGRLAYTKDDHVWTAPLDGQGKPEQLFFDRGKDSDLHWSPDGSRLAFVSRRTDHSFIGIFTRKERPILFLEPSTGVDQSPRWSPEGTKIAFVRRPGEGGAPEPMLTPFPHPWSIEVADANSGSGHTLWQSPHTFAGSYPDVEGGANLFWGAGDRLVFLTYLDDWPHLYSVAASGGSPILLTSGAFMVEHVAQSRDRRFMIYDANTGKAADDADRRHLYRVPVDRAAPLALTAGEGLEWTPVPAAAHRVAFVAAGPRQTPAVALVDAEGRHRTTLDAAPVSEFPQDKLVIPQRVTFRAADGTSVHGQLFIADRSEARGRGKPGVIFVHGGPPRQMLLGWHYMHYYSNAYAVNQYLAARGFVVLSLNYRLGIGYGRSFHEPEHAGPAGAAEYQDVLAGAQFLRSVSQVDGSRIGIWGGSYGGYLTALALARNSDIFSAGVDLHGVHDWSMFLDEWFGKATPRYEKGDREAATQSAWTSSPDSAISSWHSPVLLIQGDDDRNVPFQQTIDLARRLQQAQIPYEELVLPNEIHGFLRHATWLQVDAATSEFLTRQLNRQP